MRTSADVFASILGAVPAEWLDRMARDFEVAASTVGRWRSKASRPHPNIQVQVVEWIAEEFRAKSSDVKAED